jgi:hypothetical protein
MQTLLQVLLVFVLGAFVAGGLRAMFKTPESKQDWVVVLGFALVGGILTQGAVNSIVTARLLPQVKDRLEDRSAYRRALSAVERIPDREVRAVFQAGISDIDLQLQKIAEGKLTIDRNGVFSYWQRLIELSEEQVQATNLVSDADWELFGPGGAGTPPQREAAMRGIAITRVMVYDPQVQHHQEGLRRTACYQLRQIPNLRVYEISLQRLGHPPYQGWLRTLNTPDIVIYDEKLLLTTKTIENDRTIDFSELSTDELLLGTAQQFYRRLLQDATPVRC